MDLVARFEMTKTSTCVSIWREENTDSTVVLITSRGETDRRSVYSGPPPQNAASLLDMIALSLGPSPLGAGRAGASEKST